MAYGGVQEAMDRTRRPCKCSAHGVLRSGRVISPDELICALGTKRYLVVWYHRRSKTSRSDTPPYSCVKQGYVLVTVALRSRTQSMQVRHKACGIVFQFSHARWNHEDQ